MPETITRKRVGEIVTALVDKEGISFNEATKRVEGNIFKAGVKIVPTPEKPLPPRTFEVLRKGQPLQTAEGEPITTTSRETGKTVAQSLPFIGGMAGGLLAGPPGAIGGGLVGAAGQGALEAADPETFGETQTFIKSFTGQEPMQLLNLTTENAAFNAIANRMLEDAAIPLGAGLTRKAIIPSLESLGKKVAALPDTRGRIKALSNFEFKFDKSAGPRIFQEFVTTPLARASLSGKAGEATRAFKQAFQNIARAAERHGIELKLPKVTTGMFGGGAQVFETFGRKNVAKKVDRIVNFLQTGIDNLETLTGLKFPIKKGGTFPSISEISDNLFGKAQLQERLQQIRVRQLFKQLDSQLPEVPIEAASTKPQGLGSTLFPKKVPPNVVPIKGPININDSVVEAKKLVDDIGKQIGHEPSPEELIDEGKKALRGVYNAASDILKTATKTTDNNFVAPFEAVKNNLTTLSSLDGSVKGLTQLTNTQRLFKNLSRSLRAERDFTMSTEYPFAFEIMKDANAATARLKSVFGDLLKKGEGPSRKGAGEFAKDPVAFVNNAMGDVNKMKFMKELTGPEGINDLRANFMSRFFERFLKREEKGLVVNARGMLKAWDTGEVPGITKELFKGKRSQRKLIRDVLVTLAELDPGLGTTGVTSAYILGGKSALNITAAAAGGGTRGGAGTTVLSFLFGTSQFTRRVLLDNERAITTLRLLKDPVKHTPRADITKLMNAMRGTKVVVNEINTETGESRPIKVGKMPRKVNTNSSIVNQILPLEPEDL